MWREGYVPGGEVRFFVRAMGRGDDLAVLLHGWPQDGTAWRRVAPMLADAGYRVACPDLKGFGRTEARGAYDPASLADEMDRLIGRMHADRVVLVGHDWGGAIAIATALRHPGRIDRVVVVSSPYRQFNLRRAVHMPLFNLPAVPELLSRHAARRLVSLAVRHGSARSEAFTEDVIDHYAEVIAADPAGWLAYYRTLTRSAVVAGARRSLRRRVPLLSTSPPAPKLQVPALVLWGQHDPVLPVDLAIGVAGDLGARLHTLPGVGHFPAEEDPLTLGRELLRFMGQGRVSTQASA